MQHAIHAQAQHTDHADSVAENVRGDVEVAGPHARRDQNHQVDGLPDRVGVIAGGFLRADLLRLFPQRAEQRPDVSRQFNARFLTLEKALDVVPVEAPLPPDLHAGNLAAAHPAVERRTRGLEQPDCRVHVDQFPGTSGTCIGSLLSLCARLPRCRTADRNDRLSLLAPLRAHRGHLIFRKCSFAL